MRILFWTRPLLTLAIPVVLVAVSARAETVHERGALLEQTPAAIAIPPGAAATGSGLARLDRLELRSGSVVVMDALDDSILYAKEAARPVPIASITKLMTALVVLESGQPLDELIEITAADCQLERSRGSRLRRGTQLTRADLLRLALMSSENRAAQALGRSHPGGLPAFVRAMNARAKSLAMRSARFADPTGLSSRNVSSAQDLVKLVAAAAANAQIREFSTGGRYSVAVGRQVLEFHNTNTLVGKPDWTILVQKTGYTSDAGQCLVMQAMIRERPVTMVLLNSFGKYTRVADARRVRRWMEATMRTMQLAGSAR
jgi:serine-type D-Ala-D-Ala endopeptidase (penicillin-binding protein 7)